MKRKLIHTVVPEDGNPNNRLKVQIFDVENRRGENVGVSFSIVASTKDGSDWWVNVHPRELDPLLDMLQAARSTANHRLSEQGLPAVKETQVPDEPNLGGQRYVEEFVTADKEEDLFDE